MITFSLSARKTIASALGLAVLVTAPGPLAVSAAAQVIGAAGAASGVSAGAGAAGAVRPLTGLNFAPTSAPSLTILSAPSALIGAPAAVFPAAALPAGTLPAASLPAAAALPALTPAPSAPAALPSAVPALAPALMPAARNAATSASVPAAALETGRTLSAKIESASPAGDGSAVKNALDSFYSGIAAAAPCIFANLGKGSNGASGLKPADAAAGTPANGAAVPSAPQTPRFQIGPVHHAAMVVMGAVWSVWDRAIDSKWDKMPPLLGEIYLYFNEQALRLKLWDANALPTTAPKAYAPATEAEKSGRSADGSYFDDQTPGMAVAGAARWNQLRKPDGPPNPQFDKMEPNPLLVSEKLDKRDVDAAGNPITKEAGILNDWSAAEIQAQVHDWGNHLRQPIDQDPIRVKIPAGHPLGAAGHETEMILDRTEKDPTAPAAYKDIIHRNSETPGWDMSNIYGSTLARQLQVRALHDGKMKIGADGRLLEDPEKPGLALTGFNDNITPLLMMYHTIWTLEHNSVADALKAEHPDWNDEQIFQQARLRVTALNAKIHTVEWTRALLPNPILHSGMWADWYGFLGKPAKLWVMRFSDRNPRLGKVLGALLRYELLFGIPGTKTEHYGVNYSFSEEFFDVYRLHTMIRDWYAIQTLKTGPDGLTSVNFVRNLKLEDAIGFETIQVLKELSPEDLALSYGLESAGALTLNNVPDALRNLTTQDGRHIDLAAVDVIRTRERMQASRYVDFVKRLGEKPPKTFLELTGGDKEAAAKLASVYKTVEEVDFTAGIRAERKPALFALGNRQFKPFVVSAPARLKNDRFLSEQYDAKTYGASGMEYIEHTNFSNLLERHYPSLRPAVEGMDNAFRPWDKPGTLNDKLTSAQWAASRAAVGAGIRNLLIGSAIALAAPFLGAASVLAVASLILIPAAAALYGAKSFLESSGAVTGVLAASKGGEKTSQLAPLYAAERQGRRAALVAKLGAFTVLDVGGMIAYHLFAAHPIGALIVGAAAIYSGAKALKAAKAAAAAQTAARVGLEARLTAGLSRTDAATLKGDTALQKRYWVMLGQKQGPVAAFGDTYGALRRTGSSAPTAFLTAGFWHALFARKTWKSVPAAEKAHYNPGFFDIYIPGLIDTQGYSNTRVYSDGTVPGVKRGDVDMAEFDRLFREFGMHDYLTAYDFARIREANQDRDAREGRGNWLSRLMGRYAAKRRADQLMDLFADRVVWEDGLQGGFVPAISREQLLRFYQGGLQFDVIRNHQEGAAAPAGK